jgi:hypothetical protein
MRWFGHFLTLCIFVCWPSGTGRWLQERWSWALELGTGSRVVGDRCWAPSSPENSKVVTGASFYASAWTFPEPVQSCATVRSLCRALQQKVK